jgi:hypothetical protein
MATFAGSVLGVLVGCITAFVYERFFRSPDQHAFINIEGAAAYIVGAVVFGLWGSAIGLFIGIVWALPHRARWPLLIGVLAGGLAGCLSEGIWNSLSSSLGGHELFEPTGVDDDVAFPLLGALTGLAVAASWCWRRARFGL